MKVFVSGATGFIGIQLVKRLVNEGYTVHALYRSDSKAELIRQPGVEIFKGDILDISSLEHAMKGCEEAYHTAAFAGISPGDPGTVFRYNVDGTMNIIEAAGRQGIRRVVVTSTAGVLGPSDGETVNETTPDPLSFFTEYEASKHMMETKLLGRTKTEPEVVIVNPTRVFGPGYLSISNGVTRMIKKYVEGGWRFIPGNGNNIGNYVFVEDVVTGHLQAMKKGIPGERYILGGDNITYNQLFGLIREESGIDKKLLKIPLWLMLISAGIIKFGSKITGRTPLIDSRLVRKFNHNWIVSSKKASDVLGYHPIDARTGIQKSIQWIKNSIK
jgi:nucleoside-diphosphate-sugar epimerase